MKKKGLLTASLAVALLLSATPGVSAFSDISGTKAESHILNLKDRGVINGVKSDAFNPSNELTYAQAVTLLDQAFDLNLDNVKFVKEPVLSDYYDNMSNDAWYAQAFIEAYHNGLSFDRDIKPNDTITREQFAHALMQQIDRLGNYPLIKIYMIVEDEADITPEYSFDIQKLLILNLAELSEGGKFNPKQAITRGEAAIWLDKALEFADRTFNEEPVVEEGPQLDNVKIDLKAINDQVNQVTFSADVPHPGYGLKVASITFDEKTAYVDLQLVQPQDDMMYPQVITNVAVSTFIDKQYEVSLSSPFAYDDSDQDLNAIQLK